MFVNQQASQSNNAKDFSPPGLAKKLLSFFLPASLREPVLGDLEEEFTQRICSNNSLFAVHRWYWRQVLRSTCLFIWQQRGTSMAFLISVIFFVLVFGLALFTSEYGLWLISPPVILITIPASLALGIGATSFQAAKTAFRLSFSDPDEYPAQNINLARRFLHVTGNQFLFVSAVVFFLGTIQVLFIFSENPELLSNSSHYARYGFAMLPLFYGMIFKCLFYSAEQKILGKYLPDDGLSTIHS